jgi:polyhydroxyalkanoate synthesis regulator protein
MQALVPSYLEFSIETLTREQQKLRDAMTQQIAQGWTKAPWLGSIEEQARNNMAIFENAFRMFSPFAAAATGEPKPAPNAKADGDIDGLRKELADMKSRLDRIADTKE